VDQNGNVTVTLEESDDSPISIGFTLFVTPHIVRGTDQVIMTVIPRTNMLTGTTAAAVGGVEGFERFAFSVGAGGIESFIDLPRTRDQTVVTKMIVRDGLTAVIGGLLTEEREEITSRIPILSAIPILGNLFTFRRVDTSVSNLFIFIRPTILRTPEDQRGLYRAAHRQFRDWDPFFQREKHRKSWQPSGYLDTDKIVEFEDVEAKELEAKKAEAEMTGEEEAVTPEGTPEEPAPERPPRREPPPERP
jgi:type II secretory pathway component GspD/PulD (secretin)